MIGFEIAVVGDEAIAERFRNTAGALRERIRQALARIGEDVADRARALAPQGKSGDLRANIKPIYAETLTAQKEIVRDDVLYARFVEHGTVAHGTANNKREKGGKRVRLSRLRELRSQGQWRVKPRPFLSAAIGDMRDRIESEIADAVASAAGDVE